MPFFPLFVDLSGRRCVVIGGGPVAARKIRSLVDFGAQITVLALEASEEVRSLARQDTITLEERPYAGPADLAGAALVISAINAQGPKVDAQPLNVDAQDLNVDAQLLKVDFQDLKVDAQLLKVDFQDLKVDAQLLKVDFQDLKVDAQLLKVDFQDLKVDAQDLKVDAQNLKVDFQTSKVAAQGPRELNARIARDAQEAGIPVNIADDPALCTFFFPALVRRGDLTAGISTSGACPRLAARLRERLDEDWPADLGESLEILREERRRLRESAQTGPIVGELDRRISEILKGYVGA
jgi:siroheme synthase-like protein